jgi:hypothetical protein
MYRQRGLAGEMQGVEGKVVLASRTASSYQVSEVRVKLGITDLRRIGRIALSDNRPIS